MAILHKEYWRRSSNNKRFEGFTKTGSTGNHVKPTAYTTYGGKFPTKYINSTQPHWSDVDIPNEVPVYYGTFEYYPSLVNASWEKLINKTRQDPASLGTALAEWPEALGMITGRASQLYRGYKHLRHGQFRAFLRTFGIGAKRKHRNLVKNSINQASSLWLEYSFGWKPLTQDIYDACSALGKPVPANPVSGSSGSDYFYLRNSNPVITRWEGTAFVKQGADMYISNPNLYLMQQLGVANPLAIAWEIVPFSFMVDWVFDIGTYLGGFTDLLGLEVINPYSTFYLKVNGSKRNVHPEINFLQTGTIFTMTRRAYLSKPIPNASFLANIGTSMNRAANAVSLLGQILTK